MASIGGGCRVLLISVLIRVMLATTVSAAKSQTNGWCAVIDFTLAGFKSNVSHAKTQKLCHLDCEASASCQSSNYETASGRCELLTASHYNACQLCLVPRRGWVYAYTYAEHTDCFTEKRQEYLCQKKKSENDFPIFRTPESYPSADLSLARCRCAQCGMQLCTLAQLKAAYDAGYRDGRWGLIDIQGREAKVTSCNNYYSRLGECFIIIEGDKKKSLIPNTPRPADFDSPYCCLSCHVEKNYPILRTSEVYPSADLSQARYRCSHCGMKLCLLAQLKAAYDGGYRDDRWGLAGIDGRQAKVTSCSGDGQNVDGECFFVVEGSQTGGLIPLATSLNDSANAYCCQIFCDVSTEYPILRSPDPYPSADLSQARDRCAQCDMQLCSLRQLKLAYDAGYRDEHWGLIDIQGRHAKVTSCNGFSSDADECYFTVEGVGHESRIPNTPRPAVSEPSYCCPTCFEYQNYPIISTREKYPSADLSPARDRCAECGMQLCSLAQLKAAYDAGYRDNHWGLIDIQGRDARVTSCDNYYSQLGECFFIVDGNSSRSLIPHTPRPFETLFAFCCDSKSEVFEWQLVFKGMSGQGQGLYNMWTEPDWDENHEQNENYRNSLIYDVWNENSGQINYVKLSVFSVGDNQTKARLIFNGTGSNITNWFSKNRLVSSTWNNLNSSTHNNYLSINKESNRQYFINQDYVDGCSGETGWLVVVDQKLAGQCTWEDAFKVEQYPVILYSATKRAVPWSHVEPPPDGSVGRADFLTIHINMG